MKKFIAVISAFIISIVCFCSSAFAVFNDLTYVPDGFNDVSQWYGVNAYSFVNHFFSDCGQGNLSGDTCRYWKFDNGMYAYSSSVNTHMLYFSLPVTLSYTKTVCSTSSRYVFNTCYNGNAITYWSYSSLSIYNENVFAPYCFLNSFPTSDSDYKPDNVKRSYNYADYFYSGIPSDLAIYTDSFTVTAVPCSIDDVFGEVHSVDDITVDYTENTLDQSYDFVIDIPENIPNINSYKYSIFLASPDDASVGQEFWYIGKNSVSNSYKKVFYNDFLLAFNGGTLPDDFSYMTNDYFCSQCLKNYVIAYNSMINSEFYDNASIFSDFLSDFVYDDDLSVNDNYDNMTSALYSLECKINDFKSSSSANTGFGSFISYMCTNFPFTWSAIYFPIYISCNNSNCYNMNYSITSFEGVHNISIPFNDVGTVVNKSYKWYVVFTDLTNMKWFTFDTVGKGYSGQGIWYEHPTFSDDYYTDLYDNDTNTPTSSDYSSAVKYPQSPFENNSQLTDNGQDIFDSTIDDLTDNLTEQIGFDDLSSSLKSVSSSASSFISFIGELFPFIPNSIWSLILVGLSLLIVLRILGR